MLIVDDEICKNSVLRRVMCGIIQMYNFCVRYIHRGCYVDNKVKKNT